MRMQWGFFAAVLGGAGYTISPIYRGLTIQFKVLVFPFLVRVSRWLMRYVGFYRCQVRSSRFCSWSFVRRMRECVIGCLKRVSG